MAGVGEPHRSRLESQDDLGYLTGRHSAEESRRQIQTPGKVAAPAQARPGAGREDEESRRG